MPAALVHPLDRPVWSALTSRQAHLALGDGRAVRMEPQHGPFAAAADAAPEHLAALAALLAPGDSVGLVEADPDMPIPPGLTVDRRAAITQMVTDHITPGEPTFPVIELGEADSAEMLALAHLTEPGPFLPKTHRLGRFIGVRDGGTLVAMAGERMRVDGYTEVSAVCTHPDHRGRGYAGGLMRLVARRILASGEHAFLHAFTANTGAIGLYETLGFRVRREVILTVATQN
jgi:predicted GNAT family acetyltransferase